MGGFLTQGWDLIFPSCGGTSTLARGATPAARWLCEPQPISVQPMRVGFHTVRGGIEPGGHCFRPCVAGVIDRRFT